MYHNTVTHHLEKFVSVLHSTIKRFNLHHILEKESFVVIVFYTAHIWINTNRYYLILLGIFIYILYLQTRDIKKTLWIAFLSTFPFQQAKYFTSVFHSYTYTGVSTPIIYFVAFSDALLFALLFVVLKTKTASNSNHLKPADTILLPLILVGGVSTYYAHFFSVALFGWYQMIKLFLMYLVSRLILKNATWLKLTIEIFLLFTLYNSVLIIAQKLRSGPIGIAAENLNAWSLYGRYAVESLSFYRPAGITDDPNASATILGMFLPLMIIFGLTKNSLHKGFVWITLICSSLALIFTGSRAVWIVTGLVGAFSIYHVRKIIPIYMPLFLKKYGATLLLVFIIFASPFIYFRFQTLNQALTDFGSGTYRLHHLQIALHTALVYPFGTGLNTTAYEMALKYEPKYYMYDPSELHNMAAQIVTGVGVFGLVGFILWIVALFAQFAKSIRKRDNTLWSYAILSALVSYLLISSFYPWFLSVPISGFFWVLVALTL